MMGWPQITWIALMALSFGIAASRHGESQGKHNAFTSLVAIAINATLLYYGGFFG